MENIVLGVVQLKISKLWKGPLPDVPERVVKSIREHGSKVLLPITVRPDTESPGSYEVIGGVGEWRAALYANLVTIPVQCHPDCSDEIALEYVSHECPALWQGRKPDPITLAKRIVRRTQEGKRQNRHFSQADAGAKLDLSVTETSHLVRLLKLCDELQNEIQAREFPVRIARLCVSLSEENQKAVLKEFQDKTIRLGRKKIYPKTRAMEAFIATLTERHASNSGRPQQAIRGPQPSWVPGQERGLRELLGMVVEIRDAGGKGEIAFRYFSFEELTGLYDRLNYKPV